MGVAAASICTTRRPETAGVDGVRIADLYGSALEDIVDALAVDLARDQYVPAPLRATTVRRASALPRAVYIETVRDQIVGLAIARVVGAAYEMVAPSVSFSFRPRLSSQDAAVEIASYVGALPLDDGHFIRVDIERFFSSIDVKALKPVLANVLPDRRLRRLIFSLLCRPARIGRRLVRRRTGIPEGAALSPVISNLYLLEIDRLLERRGRQGVRWLRYADDFLGVHPGTLASASAELEVLSRALGRVQLKPEATKTCISPCTAGIEFLGLAFKRTLARECSILVSPRNSERLLERVRARTNDSLDRGVELPVFTQTLRDALVGWVSAFRVASDAEAIAEWCGHRALMDRLAGDPHVPIDRVEKHARTLGTALWGWSGSS